MFNKDFYPTPKEIAYKMTANIPSRAFVLEPSAGKGDIVDCLKNSNCLIYCIEKDVELQRILRDKNYNLIDTDFLSYNNEIIFDYIIMNPPFSNGDKHLLKAWEISNGAEIRCLLNAETINNPYSKTRELICEIISKHGKVENLGQCFMDAERKTKVDVVLITLKDKDYKSKFEFNGDVEKETDIKFDVRNEIAIKNEFLNLEIRYNKVKDLMLNLVKLIDEMQFYGDSVIKTSHYEEIPAILKKCEQFKGKRLFNDFMTIFREQSWKKLFYTTNIEKYITTKVRNDFTKMRQENSTLAFTQNNMLSILQFLYLNQDNIIQNSIEEAFDYLTAYYKENRIHIEGWKTNDRWQVNKKVILPYALDSYNFGRVSICHRMRDQLRDIEKALCFIAGKNIDNIKDIVKSIQDFNCYGSWCDTEFFRAKVYKKGTLHLEFKDEYIWTQFNISACKSKNWLKGT